MSYFDEYLSATLPCHLVSSSQYTIQVRSQSESAALNNISIKVPRNLFHDYEMYRHKLQSGGGGVSAASSIVCPTPCCSPAGISFYSLEQEDAIQSDSEGDDSLVSSSDDSSSTECASGVTVGGTGVDQLQHDIDDDLGVELELDDVNAMNQQRLNTAAAFSQCFDGVESGASSSSVLSTASSVSSSTSTLKSDDFYITTNDDSTNGCSSSRENQQTEAVNRLATLLMSTTFQQAAAITPSTPISEKLLDTSAKSKAVRFADECGKRLEVVRVMTEPSDYPPLINPAVIRRYRKAAASANAKLNSDSASILNDDDDEDSDDAKRLRSTWKITFKQPASEYVKFRETLEHQKVALENVMLKNEVGRMVGTIKVGNISFEKRVFIRFTVDNWQSFMDRPAIYQSSPSKVSDTFRFDIEIPRDNDNSSRIEFCVCFVAGPEGSAEEHWDSNGGQNFALIGSNLDHTSALSPMPKSPQTPTKSPTSNSLSTNGGIGHLASWMTDDAYRMDYTNWTKFASWKNLKTDVPYW